MLPHPAQLAAGKPIPDAKRVAEDTAARTANAKVYRLADGRRQSEVSTHPLHYRDGSGRWQDIDTRVQPSNHPAGRTRSTATPSAAPSATAPTASPASTSAAGP